VARLPQFGHTRTGEVGRSSLLHRGDSLLRALIGRPNIFGIQRHQAIKATDCVNRLHEVRICRQPDRSVLSLNSPDLSLGALRERRSWVIAAKGKDHLRQVLGRQQVLGLKLAPHLGFIVLVLFEKALGNKGVTTPNVKNRTLRIVYEGATSSSSAETTVP
jgi:hypothetical protein